MGGGGGRVSSLCTLCQICQNSALNSLYRSLNSLCCSLNANLSLKIQQFKFLLKKSYAVLLVIARFDEVKSWQSIAKFRFHCGFYFANARNALTTVNRFTYEATLALIRLLTMTAHRKFTHAKQFLLILLLNFKTIQHKGFYYE